MHLAGNIDLVSGLAGGCILGLSTSALLFATGKITGISGIFEVIINLNPNKLNDLFTFY